MTTTESMAAPVSDGPDDVLTLLREQSTLYLSLESLAQEQRGLVSSDDVGPLLALLADRQKLSNRLTRLGQRLAPIRRRWPEYRDRLSTNQRDEAESLLRDSGERLRRIIERDEQDAHMLSARKQSTANTLRAIHATGQAMTAYRVPGAPARHIDCVNEGM